MPNRGVHMWTFVLAAHFAKANASDIFLEFQHIRNMCTECRHLIFELNQYISTYICFRDITNICLSVYIYDVFVCCFSLRFSISQIHHALFSLSLSLSVMPHSNRHLHYSKNFPLHKRCALRYPQCTMQYWNQMQTLCGDCIEFAVKRIYISIYLLFLQSSYWYGMAYSYHIPRVKMQFTWHLARKHTQNYTICYIILVFNNVTMPREGETETTAFQRLWNQNRNDTAGRNIDTVPMSNNKTEHTLYACIYVYDIILLSEFPHIFSVCVSMQ